MDKVTGRLAQIVTFLDSETRQEVLRRSGLEEPLGGFADEMDPKKEAKFLQHACDVLNDQTFAMHVGLNLGEIGTLTNFIAKASSNLRSAIEHSQRYYGVVDPSHKYSLHVSSNSASFIIERTDPSFNAEHRFIEFLLLGALSRMRVFAGVQFLPLEIRFEHEFAGSIEALERMVGFPLVFAAERAEIILPLSALELPIPTYNPSLRTHLMQYGERLLKELPSHTPSLREKIEAELAANLPGHIGSAEEIAASLGMSRSTFARRLKSEDVSFRTIVDDLRCDVAKNYLESGFGISEIAFYLDYADQASFSTAFKRWTGLSPGEYRKARNSH